MHILVTGGAGRVGRRLIPHLLARGDSVAAAGGKRGLVALMSA